MTPVLHTISVSFFLREKYKQIDGKHYLRAQFKIKRNSNINKWMVGTVLNKENQKKEKEE